MTKEASQRWMEWRNAQTTEQKREYDQHRYQRDRIKISLRQKAKRRAKAEAEGRAVREYKHVNGVVEQAMADAEYLSWFPIEPIDD